MPDRVGQPTATTSGSIGYVHAGLAATGDVTCPRRRSGHPGRRALGRSVTGREMSWCPYCRGGMPVLFGRSCSSRPPLDHEGFAAGFTPSATRSSSALPATFSFFQRSKPGPLLRSRCVSGPRSAKPCGIRQSKSAARPEPVALVRTPRRTSHIAHWSAPFSSLDYAHSIAQKANKCSH